MKINELFKSASKNGEKLGNSVAESAKNYSKTVGKKSNDIVQSVKLKMDLKKKGEEIKSLYYKIGQIIYDQYSKQDYNYSNLQEYLNKIDLLNKSIEEMNDELLAIKGKKMCPNCELEANREVIFCPTCGYKFTNLVVSKKTEE